jgi:ATP-binding cassette subfamily F protein 3
VQDEESMALRFDSGERGGDIVVSAVNVTISVGERTLVTGFTGTLHRGDVLGLLGPNGTGKTTLLKALFGDHPVSSGELRFGSSINAGFYRQDLGQVPLGKPIYDVIADLRPHWERRLVQGHLGRFGFSGDEVQRRAGVLSGGERARVALAMLMLSRHNLLVLDEPTNHLDVESIESLEDAMERYGGTVILVSHDRELLRALTTRVWVLHDLHVTEFDGGFDEWEVVSAERAHAASVRAAEEEGLRRMHERQKVARSGAREKTASGDKRRHLKTVEEDLARVELRVAELEARVASITVALEEPALYTRPDGVSEAKRLGIELDTAKRELDKALEAWARASEALERVISD